MLSRFWYSFTHVRSTKSRRKNTKVHTKWEVWIILIIIPYALECEWENRERESSLLKKVYVEKGDKRVYTLYIQHFCWLVQRCILYTLIINRIVYVTFFVGSYVYVCEFLQSFKDTLIWHCSWTPNTHTCSC